MKLFLAFFLGISSLFTGVNWLNDITVAKEEAVKEGKFILLNFSGSDWCGPCIRMHKEVFESPAFQEFASRNLVLVNADFPRSKKNKLNPEQTRKNEVLAEKYNKEGKFPYTVLLDAGGSVIKAWEGFPDKPVGDFIVEVNSAFHANKPK